MARTSSKLVMLITLVVVWALVSIPPAFAGQSALTVINFFLHDDFLPLAPTVPSTFIEIPPLAGTATLFAPNSSAFGLMAVLDDSMTIEPDPKSLEIGRGRGFYFFVQNSTTGPALEFVFTTEFNAASGHGVGSTLLFQGFDRYTEPVRELAIVGGTGKFRMARGWAEITTFSYVVGTYAANLNVTAYFTYGFGN